MLLDTSTRQMSLMYSACVLYGIGCSCFKPKATNYVAFYKATHTLLQRQRMAKVRNSTS